MIKKSENVMQDKKEVTLTREALQEKSQVNMLNKLLI